MKDKEFCIKLCLEHGSRVIYEADIIYINRHIYSLLVHAYTITGQSLHIKEIQNVNGMEKVLSEAKVNMLNSNYHGGFKDIEALINGTTNVKNGDTAVLHTHEVIVDERKIDVGPITAIYSNGNWSVDIDIFKTRNFFSINNG